MTRISYLVTTMVMAAGVLVQGGKQNPTTSPRIGAETAQGCFKSEGELEDKGGYVSTSVSSGMCKDEARDAKALVFALKGEKCYLGNTYPPEDDLVDDDKCNFDCPGYPNEACMYRGRGSETNAMASLTDSQVVVSQEARFSPFSTLVSSWTSSIWSQRKPPKHPPRRQKVIPQPFPRCSLLCTDLVKKRRSPMMKKKIRRRKIQGAASMLLESLLVPLSPSLPSLEPSVACGSTCVARGTRRLRKSTAGMLPSTRS